MTQQRQTRFHIQESMFADQDDPADIVEVELRQDETGKQVVSDTVIGKLIDLGHGNHQLVCDRYNLNMLSAPKETREQLLDRGIEIMSRLPKRKFLRPSDYSLMLF